MKIKLVIFDLDGTLLNTVEDLANSVNYLLQKYGYPTHTIDQYKYFVGNGITKLIERALPIEAKTDEIVAKFQAEFVIYYSQHSKDNTAPYDGVIELLKELKNKGLILAVASNKHHPATVELIEYYFKDTFAIVYGKREGVQPKPDPTIVFDIVKQCGFSTDEILYVGDTSTDMLTAKNASVRSVGVTWGFRPQQELEENGATYIINAPSQLLDLL